MTLYRGTALTWQDGDVNWNQTQIWQNVNGQASGTITATGTAQDLGDDAWVWPSTQVDFDGVGAGGTVIEYLTSLDNITYSAATPPGALFGRFFKTRVTADADVIYGYRTQLSQENINRVYINIDTATLSGTTAARSFNFSQDFSAVFGVTVTQGVGNTDILSAVIIDADPANFVFRLVDLDTYGKIAVDGFVNLVVTGFPRLIVNTAAGFVRRGDQ